MPTVPSVYFGEDDEGDLERFDDHWSARRSGSWSRSDEIKRAMRIHREIDEILAEADIDPPTMRDRSAMVRQAMRDYVREDSDSGSD
ncbi:hypothetical protein [Halorubrum ezzemoulense]|uniref:Uncharacterized protein n=1 Tax=Halorubrum ezzemoulense TaxID=337243 RepID=A0A256JRU0_HALEZ|nr:hypothetical protein [Halorubrum ezzemoulense]OYR71585.1 hypothetical protein DJ78_05060 [Halorubrum ezzemoulense]